MDNLCALINPLPPLIFFAVFWGRQMLTQRLHYPEKFEGVAAFYAVTH